MRKGMAKTGTGGRPSWTVRDALAVRLAGSGKGRRIERAALAASNGAAGPGMRRSRDALRTVRRRREPRIVRVGFAAVAFERPGPGADGLSKGAGNA